MKVEVTDTAVDVYNGVGKNGAPFTSRKQSVYFHLGGKYPEYGVIRLAENQPPYPPGVYVLSPSSYYLDRYRGLAVSPELVPASAVSK